jgi:hypothetical protein
MSSPAYADPGTLFGTSLPKVWNAADRHRALGDLALLLFLLAQCLDGVFTYVGVVTYGRSIEANPLMLALMAYLGHGCALMGAKSTAALLGIGLHVRRAHLAVALLAVFYLVVAVLPWMSILFG